MSFLRNLINGISLGSVYAIIALGYTMVYGIAKMLNFAHGDVIMVGAYVVFVAMSNTMPAVPAVLLSIVICTGLGILIERIAYRPLRNASSPLAVLITAIGVSYLLQNLALLIFRIQSEIIRIRGECTGSETGRRKTDDYRRNHRDHCCLADHCFCADGLHQ